ncbi:sodium hydrogen exchanger [Stylonychia lemnae]|uniref:Sodium/hydrogen exchanger n=1 Tax=Stylonychia lemnae TaxID=5949 RepID=A0A078AM65_STYLE|nr:sodium hydrogen exchanger [Stylonychia lemnae]|eukprot:CDW83475.1 sodium hydrogen exchanger [Stylonychia lemnae]
MSATLFSQGAIVIMLVLLFYMFVGSVLEKYHCKIGHEAGLVIIFGMLLSFLTFQTGHEDFNKLVTFDDNLFFYFCLPPIVFASGYNMKRRMFFRNFTNILLFGLFGTLITFSAFSIMTYIVCEFDILWKYNGHTGEYEQFTLSIMEILLMCSLLCCTDVVAAISIIKYDEQPKLFSLVFGEGITNDAVCIILFNTVMEYAGPNSEFTTSTPFKIVGSFINLSFFSILVGIVTGIISSIVTKNFRFLTVKPVVECTLIFSFGYLSYCVAELFHFSGIISLLASSILMAKYSWYNLSPQSKQVTSIAFNVIGYAVEAFVFGYLGLTFFSYVAYEWSWQLFIAELIIVISGRFMGTIGIIKFLEMFGYKSGIRFKDLIFISYAGMIRGAVAFGLVLRINHEVANRSVIVTTSLALVVFTTVVMGSTVATVQYCLFGKEMAEAAKAAKEGKPHLAHDESHHEIVEHPNVEDVNGEGATPAAGDQPKKKQGCAQIMRRLDLMIIKPLLIYNYEKGTHKKQKIFNELLMLEGEKLEEIFTNKENENKDIRKSQLLEYLNAKQRKSEVGNRSFNRDDPEKSERLDSDRSGQIEMQAKPTSIKGLDVPYQSLYKETPKQDGASYPLLDIKNNPY